MFPYTYTIINKCLGIVFFSEKNHMHTAHPLVHKYTSIYIK